VDNVINLGDNGLLLYNGPASDWLASKEDIAKEQDEALPEEPTRMFQPEDYEEDKAIRKSEDGFDDNVETIKRQRGDTATWLYYGKAIGFLTILAIIISICINVFGNNFQSESS
jgi:hypothetical protein